MKEDMLFAILKDKPLENSKEFKNRMKKYGKINSTDLYIRITNYQIETYGYSLNSFDPNWFEDKRLNGFDTRSRKRREYRKGNKI